MASRERKCVLCGKKYKHCNNCSDNAHKNETWRNIYCSDNCRKIFDILSANAFDHITDQAAKEKLKGLDLSKVEDFRDDFKKQVKKIQSASGNAEVQPQNREIVKHELKK